MPEEVSVTGYDNIDDSYRMTPALKTVHVPKEALGKRAVDRLISRIESKQEPMEKLLVAGELLYRESTGQVNPSFTR